MLKSQTFPLACLIPLMPAFREKWETSETFLFKLGELFSAQVLSAGPGSGGDDLQGLGTELLHVPPSG